MSESILRQITMLRLIPRAPKKVDPPTLTSHLAEKGFQTTTRTVQRDLNNLSRVFPLGCDERSRPFGWSWTEDAPLTDMPGMDPQTALTFQLADQYLAQALPRPTLSYLEKHLDRASEILNQLGSANGLSEWKERVRILHNRQPLNAPDVSLEVIHQVYQAVLDNRPLTIEYRPRYAEDNAYFDYRLHPVGLIFRGHRIYLVAFDPEEEAERQIRHFLLHRMRSAEVHEGECLRPENFDLDEYIDRGKFDFDVGTPIRIHVRFDDEAARHLEETPLSDDQQLRPSTDGTVDLRATVNDTMELRWWLLGFGDSIEVLAPKALRQEFIEISRRMASLYSE